MTMEDIYKFWQKDLRTRQTGKFQQILWVLNTQWLYRTVSDWYRKNTLEAIIVTHQSGLQKSRRFSEAIAMDATYQNEQPQNTADHCCRCQQSGHEIAT